MGLGSWGWDWDWGWDWGGGGNGKGVRKGKGGEEDGGWLKVDNGATDLRKRCGELDGTREMKRKE